MSVRWAPGARSGYLRFLRELGLLSRPAAHAAHDTVVAVLEMLAQHPLRGRSSSRWPECREWSLLRQHKLLVYRHDDDGLMVVGFFDTRQDLFAVLPE